MKLLRTLAGLAASVAISSSGLFAQMTHDEHEDHDEHAEHMAHEGHHASPEDHAAVMETLGRMFDGMRANDGDMVLSAFHPNAMLIGTERGRTGEPAISYTPISRFAEAVGNGQAPWDEPIWDEIVHVDDHLAVVWVKYAFFMGGTNFSHCGINAFTLSRDENSEWKIVSIADSRQFEDCEMPPGRDG